MSAQRCTMRPHGGICATPATVDVTVGCVHEHVFDGRLCDDHLKELQDGNAHCSRCYLGDDPHKCVVMGRVMA